MDLTEIWRYPRFFTADINSMTVSESDLRHAERVLRMKPGDKAVLCDNNGIDYLCRYSGGGGFSVIESVENKAEPNMRLRLYQCLPKSDKMDYIVQKAVELGISEIVPAVSLRCVSRPIGKSRDSKVARWNKIAYEAAKQCGRGKIPTVGKITGFRDAVAGLNKNELNIIFYECGGERLSSVLSGKLSAEKPTGGINVIIGSEGGFEREEVEFAIENGAVTATLGKRILRVDTASVAAIAVIMELTGNN